MPLSQLEVLEAERRSGRVPALWMVALGLELGDDQEREHHVVLVEAFARNVGSRQHRRSRRLVSLLVRVGHHGWMGLQSPHAARGLFPNRAATDGELTNSRTIARPRRLAAVALCASIGSGVAACSDEAHERAVAPTTTRRATPTVSTAASTVPVTSIVTARSLADCRADVGAHYEPITLLPTDLPAGFEFTSGATTEFTYGQTADTSVVPAISYLLAEIDGGTITSIVTLSRDIGPSYYDLLVEELPVIRTIRGGDGVAGTYVNRGNSIGSRRAEWTEAGHHWTAVSQTDVEHLVDLLGRLRISGTNISDVEGRVAVVAQSSEPRRPRAASVQIRPSGATDEPTAERPETVYVSAGAPTLEAVANLIPPGPGPRATVTNVRGRTVAADDARAVTMLSDGTIVVAASRATGITRDDLVGLVTSFEPVAPTDPRVIDLPLGPTVGAPVCIGAPETQHGP